MSNNSCTEFGYTLLFLIGLLALNLFVAIKTRRTFIIRSSLAKFQQLKGTFSGFAIKLCFKHIQEPRPFKIFAVLDTTNCVVCNKDKKDRRK
jgi:hypothetical protein